MNDQYKGPHSPDWTPDEQAASEPDFYGKWIKANNTPPPHVDLWCLNRCGRQFQGRICLGMHKPFFTLCYGEKDGSDTCPPWIDVTHYMELPPGPAVKPV